MSQTPALPRAARRSRWRSVLRYGGIALVILGVGIYVARHEIGNALARKFRERLASVGIYMEWKSTEWTPGSGIKLRDMALYRDTALSDRLALLSEVTLVKREPGWNRWDAVQANVSDARLTLGNSKSEMILEHLDVHLELQPGKMTMRECRADLQNLRIEVTGTYVREASATRKSERKNTEAKSQRGGVFDNVDLGPLEVFNQWMKLKPERGEALLKLDFHPSAEGSGLDLAATLEGQDFVWQGQQWDFIEAGVKAAVGQEGPSVQTGTLRVGLEGRTAEFEVEYAPARRLLRISRFESGLGLLTLVRAMVPKGSTVLTNLASTGAWHMSGEGEIPLDHPEKIRWNAAVKLDGALDFASPQFRVALEKPACTFGVNEGTWFVSDFKAGVWGGQLHVPRLQGHATQGNGKPRVDIQVVLQQARLESFLSSFGVTEAQPGTFELDWKVGGEMDLTSLAGSGMLSLSDAGLFSVPKQDRLALVGNLSLTKGERQASERDGTAGVLVNLADARLTLGSGNEQTDVKDLTARLSIASGDAELQELKARTLGLRIEAKGTWGQVADDSNSKDEATQPKTKTEDAGKQAASKKPAAQGKPWLDGVKLDWLKTLKQWVYFDAENDEPVLKLAFKPMANRRELDLEASLEGKKVQWRGQKWDSVKATLKTFGGKGKSVVYPSELRLGQGGDAIALTGDIDPANKVIHIGKIDSDLDYLTLVRTLAPKALPSLAGISTTGDCHITGNGEIPLDRPKNMHWNADVQIDGDLAYANKKFRLAVVKPAGTLRVQGDEWTFAGLKGRLWGGDLDVPMLQLQFPAGKKKSGFDTEIALKDARLEAVLAGFGEPQQKQPGTVHFSWKGGGPFDVALFAGTGTASIKDAEFGRLPIFGTLGRVLDKMTPGVGRDSSTQVSTEHRTGKGVVNLVNLDLQTQQMQIKGVGAIDLSRQYAEFTGDLDLKGAVGLATRPLRSLTEITGAGPLGAVEWEKDRKGLLQRIGDDED